MELNETVGNRVGLLVIGEVVGEDDGVLDASTEGVKLGVEDTVADGSEDTVADGSDDVVTDGLELLVTVGNAVGSEVTGGAVGEDDGPSE
mmetsp:Transcript_1260/g.3601  ORF Transcript_1260/g.3601 Transcript_1260/m.3601 type:complete len:90 (-) Transcript_1260:277-546(-)